MAGPDPGSPPIGVPISDRAAFLTRVYIGANTVLLVLCLVAFSTRIYHRVRPTWHVGLDDYFITAGFALTITDYALLLPSGTSSPGLLPFPDALTIARNAWLAIAVWGLAMTCTKLSIALTLLRIFQRTASPVLWRVFLWATITLQTLYGVGNTLFVLALACRPLEAAWDPNFAAGDGEGGNGGGGGGCVAPGTMKAVSNTGSSINIATDVLLSVAPAVAFLWTLQRPLRERVLVCVLMGMGLVASVFSVMKTVLVQNWVIGRDLGSSSSDGEGEVMDVLAQGIAISTFTVLEQLLGVLAACVPAMKGWLQRCLGAMGIPMTRRMPSSGEGQYRMSRGWGTGRGNGTGRTATSAMVGEGNFERLESHGNSDLAVGRNPNKGFDEVSIPMTELEARSAHSADAWPSGDSEKGLRNPRPGPGQAL
ncbi:uncharacterized protein C8A04DRAFT_31063 [Dichotomopilus funicola]|uniref:Rhodopsin domain-containing protein n=1 Tax=Dichotomopilus funicola TaxID=1934379 RepID=A0AAN6UYV6_9PEZI|nr:hypothetical protein C8A04DRAFT_31063 [Dichotomopilus funicola]